MKNLTSHTVALFAVLYPRRALSQIFKNLVFSWKIYLVWNRSSHPDEEFSFDLAYPVDPSLSKGNYVEKEHAAQLGPFEVKGPEHFLTTHTGHRMKIRLKGSSFVDTFKSSHRQNLAEMMRTQKRKRADCSLFLEYTLSGSVEGEEEESIPFEFGTFRSNSLKLTLTDDKPRLHTFWAPQIR